MGYIRQNEASRRVAKPKILVGHFGPLSQIMGHFGPISGVLGLDLGHFGPLLEIMGHFGPISGVLAQDLGCFGKMKHCEASRSLRFRRFWARIWVILGLFWRLWAISGLFQGFRP